MDERRERRSRRVEPCDPDVEPRVQGVDDTPAADVDGGMRTVAVDDDVPDDAGCACRSARAVAPSGACRVRSCRHRASPPRRPSGTSSAPGRSSRRHWDRSGHGRTGRHAGQARRGRRVPRRPAAERALRAPQRRRRPPLPRARGSRTLAPRPRVSRSASETVLPRGRESWTQEARPRAGRSASASALPSEGRSASATEPRTEPRTEQDRWRLRVPPRLRWPRLR